MNIILTGYRGSGKTTIGKALAKRLKREFIDTDDLIEEKERMKIKDIFDKRGWQYFRKVEKLVIQELAKRDNAVIAVGGGAFMYKENLCLEENARVVLLIAPLEVISERIKSDPNRPPLTEGQSSIEEIRDVWGRRKERYYSLADAVVDTGDGDVKRAVEEIAVKLNLE
ncbi:MAG: shikimate kinase [Candidatus Jacksonbacteria bacterium]|nr:shikimate kinase [Candidatus Jacksonbacteria bacterium]